ncbi:Steroid 5-alpha-reductase DET2 [Camellia lanceoleosa]|uniref:Steroid 5-alpha-reductase DET2 n=1 Tax=Camellia lanceoleosa TaxID=1840588 RepID=A0ACC0H3K8_9ERIC|nr:Steroid 5-alpha-reductase DET2 [Camellia lanceoleosa]
MSVISAASLANAGISEIKGKHMQYSKFWNNNNNNNISSNNSQKSSSSSSAKRAKLSTKTELELGRISAGAKDLLLLMFSAVFAELEISIALLGFKIGCKVALDHCLGPSELCGVLVCCWQGLLLDLAGCVGGACLWAAWSVHHGSSSASAACLLVCVSGLLCLMSLGVCHWAAWSVHLGSSSASAACLFLCDSGLCIVKAALYHCLGPSVWSGIWFQLLGLVLFIHKYSSVMYLDVAIPISLSYFISTSTMIYVQHLTLGFPDPPLDLKDARISMFLMGISGNLYHHYLLSKLREQGDKGYKIPKGGLFDRVICPHYLFEILGFIGISCISQTLYAFSFTLGTTIYLTGRSYATRRRYLTKFQDFPKNIKALIPFVL